MFVVGAFTIVYDNPEDAVRVQKEFSQVSQRFGNRVRFEDGAAMRRSTGTRPSPRANVVDVSMTDFMGTRRNSAKRSPIG